MKAKLIKTGSDYLLRDMGGNVLAITNGTTEGRKLSKQNCDEIFGVIDVEKLATGYDLYEKINFVGQTRAYKAGFQKAMELNKDKVFTIEDIRKAYQQGEEDSYLKGGLTKTKEDNYIQSLQQPTEIEVEIEMFTPAATYGHSGWHEEPKLDKNGCLILKRI